jgi:threonine/homoserine/homoserine lactone efflux protein
MTELQKKMVNVSLLSAFIPTFFIVSITPGMCMTMALSLGITVGVRRAMWMMIGEIFGVGLVAATSAVGVATFMLRYPLAFELFRYAGGAYLIWLGVQLWRAGQNGYARG